MRAQDYIDTFTEQIRCKKARGVVRQEICSHIEEQKEAFQKAGMSECEAEIAAVEDMGDPVEAGISMDRIHRPKMAWGTILIIALLSMGGYVLQYTWKGDMLEQIVFGGLALRHMIYMLAGFLLMVGICFLDYSRIGVWAKELTILLCIVLCVGMWMFGLSVNGVKVWIPILGFSLNARMGVLLFVPLYGAIVYHYRGQSYQGVWKCVFWMVPSLVTAIWCKSILLMTMLFLSFAVILGMAVYKKWFQVSHKLTFAGLGITSVVCVVCSLVFSPMSSAATQQMEIVQEVVSKSKWIGAGTSAVKVAETPLEFVDYALTYIFAHYGILAVVLVVGMVACLFIYLVYAVCRQKNQLGMLMGVGACTIVLVQILFYVMGNMGIAFDYMYCPFLTYGGSGILVTYMLIGLLLSIYRYQNVLGRDVKTSRRFRKIRLIVEE